MLRSRGDRSLRARHLPGLSGVDSLSLGSRWRDHAGVRHRNVVLAYGLFGLSLLLAVVAIAGSLLAGLDREAALSTYLVTNTAIGLSAAPCGFLIARA